LEADSRGERVFEEAEEEGKTRREKGGRKKNLWLLRQKTIMNQIPEEL